VNLLLRIQPLLSEQGREPVYASRHHFFRTVAVALLAWVCPALGLAQQNTPLSEILPELLGNTIILFPTNIADQPTHVAHFKPGPNQLLAPAQVNRALVTLLSTYPLGSPSGGFTYTFDPSLGTLTRSSESFGPSFAERALTTGRGKVSIGLGYQHAAYDTFEGLDLRHREITFYVPHADCCSRGATAEPTPDGSRLTPAFEGDIVEAALALELVSDTSIVFASYGVSDRFDIGIAVPFVRVELNASVLARLDRLATSQEPSIHVFEGTDPDQRVFRLSGVASGLGDIVLRAKYAFTTGTSLGLAAAVETRLPTGDETNLLGTGGVQSKVFAIASLARGPLSPHVNVGYTFSRKSAPAGLSSRDETIPTVNVDSLPDEIMLTAGLDLALTPRVTMSFDVLGRSLRDAGRMRLAQKTFEFAGAGTGTGGGGGGGGTGRPPQEATPTQSTTRTELTLQSGDLRLFLGAAGIRFNPWRTVLVTANLLFPLTTSGLRDRVTPVVGIDYVF
jgi:hypothetical protein